jgi:hypothetical protein
MHWQSGLRDAASVTAAEAAESQSEVRNAASAGPMVRQTEQRYFALAPAFLQGDRLTVAGASLVSAVNEAASEAGVQLGALQVDADSSSSRAAAIVGVRGDGSGDVAGVTRFLSIIEGGVPLLSFHELTITAADARGGDAAPETLRIAFVIQGLARYDSHAGDTGAQE